MKRNIFLLLSVCALAATACNDFLTKENPNSIESEYFFKDETSLTIYSNSMIRSWMPAIIDFINGDRYTDTHGWDGLYNFYTDKYDVGDMTSWSWSFLRTVNYYLEHMGDAAAPAPGTTTSSTLPTRTPCTRTATPVPSSAARSWKTSTSPARTAPATPSTACAPPT